MDGRSWKAHLGQWMRKLRVDVEYDSDYARARGAEAVTLPSLDHQVKQEQALASVAR